MSTIKSISSRIWLATFNGNPAKMVIVAYAPTNDKKNEAEAETFYKDLRRAIDESPPHNFLTILGDLNAKINSDHLLFPYVS